MLRKAEGLLEQAVSLRRQVGVEADLASTAGALGSVRGKLGQFRAAVPLLRESLAIQRRLRPDHRDVARVENDLGVVLYYVDECSESRELLSRALRYAEANGPRGIISTAKNNLGLCDARLAEFDKAIAHYQEALAIDKEAGPLTAANAMTNLGVALAFKARYAEAEPLLVESVDIRRRLLSTAHPELSRSLSNLARVLLEIGDVDRAMVAQEEAGQIRSNLPRGALAAADSYTAGAVLLGRGKWTEAATKLRDAVDLGREFLGAEHHDTLQSISALSAALARTGHREEALSLQKEALGIARRRFGERHSLVAVCETRLAALLVDQGLNEEALTNAKHAAQTVAALHGPDHPRRADALMVAGRALAGLGRSVDAGADLTEALRIRKLKVRPGSALIREAEIAAETLGKERATRRGPKRPSGHGRGENQTRRASGG